MDQTELTEILAEQLNEHYEITAYGCVRTHDERLGLDGAASLLQETLDEGKETDAKPNKASEALSKNVGAGKTPAARAS